MPNYSTGGRGLEGDELPLFPWGIGSRKGVVRRVFWFPHSSTCQKSRARRAIRGPASGQGHTTQTAAASQLAAPPFLSRPCRGGGFVAFRFAEADKRSGRGTPRTRFPFLAPRRLPPWATHALVVRCVPRTPSGPGLKRANGGEEQRDNGNLLVCLIGPHVESGRAQ